MTLHSRKITPITVIKGAPKEEALPVISKDINPIIDDLQGIVEDLVVINSSITTLQDEIDSIGGVIVGNEIHVSTLGDDTIAEPYNMSKMYSTPQAAINAASVGDTIVVHAGTYDLGSGGINFPSQNLDINIVLESGAILSSPDIAINFYLTNRITISGSGTIRGLYPLYFSGGIQNITIKGVTLESTTYGVLISSNGPNTHLTLENVKITGFTTLGITINETNSPTHIVLNNVVFVGAPGSFSVGIDQAGVSLLLTYLIYSAFSNVAEDSSMTNYPPAVSIPGQTILVDANII